MQVINLLTDTYRSGISEQTEDIRDNLPSRLNRGVRSLHSSRSSRRRRVAGNKTPSGSLRHRNQDVRGMDETDFQFAVDEENVHAQEEIRQMATSLERKKTVLYVKGIVSQQYLFDK